MIFRRCKACSGIIAAAVKQIQQSVGSQGCAAGVPVSVRLIVEVFFTAEDFEEVEVIHAGCVEIRAYAGSV